MNLPAETLRTVLALLSDQASSDYFYTAELDNQNRITTQTRYAKKLINPLKTPAGKALIYTGDRSNPTTKPGLFDLREIIENKRPYICRAVQGFGKTRTLVCYSPGPIPFDFVRRNLLRLNSSREAFRNSLYNRWKSRTPVTDPEKSLMNELSKRHGTMHDILHEMAPDILDTQEIKL